MTFDSFGAEIFIGTEDGKTYVHGVEEPKDTFLQLRGTEKDDPITTLKTDSKNHFLFAGTLSGKLYKKGIQNVTDWNLIGNLYEPITAMNSAPSRTALGHIYASTNTGHVYIRAALKDTQWWDLGTPAGINMTEALMFLPTSGMSLLNSQGILYLRSLKDDVWYQIQKIE